MRIELCEDDGFLHSDKRVRLVVLQVTDDDKRFRVPYPADKTISEIYSTLRGEKHNTSVSGNTTCIKSTGQSDEDTNKQQTENSQTLANLIEQGTSAVGDVKYDDEFDDEPHINTQNNKGRHRKRNDEIQRGDMVECVHLEPDIDGNTNEDIVIGGKYRVIDIFKKNKRVVAYEVLDDMADAKIRIRVLPHEMKLFKKFDPPPPRKMRYDISAQCDCGEMMSLFLDDDTGQYIGTCDECGAKRYANNPKQNEKPKERSRKRRSTNVNRSQKRQRKT